jgi:hypothetical protein
MVISLSSWEQALWHYRQRMGISQAELAARVGGLAVRTGNADLKRRMKMSPSALAKLSEANHAAFRALVLQEAQARLSDLTSFGIGQPELDALEASIAVYSQLVLAPRMAVLGRSEKTRLLRDQFDKASAILRDEIDPLMLVLSRQQPGLLERYRQARVIIDLGQRSAADEPQSGES